MKKVLAMLLVVATLFCVAACGGNDTTTDNTTTVADNTTTTTVADNTTTVADNNTTTVADDNTTTTVEDETTTTTTAATTTTTTKAPTTTVKQPIMNGVDSTVADNWKKVVNNVFTSDKGGLQMKADGWKTYGLYNISMVPEEYANSGTTNAVCIQVYDADPADVFAAKTEADFESVLLADINSFSSTTVDGYPAYKAIVDGMYYVWVVNTPTYKYFINFMQVEGQADMHEIGKAMMATVEIYK